MWRSACHDEILYRIRRTKKLWRHISITEGILTFLLLLLGTLLPALLLESLLHFSVWIRLPFFGILVLGGVAAAVVYVFRPILTVRTDEEVALRIEETFPDTGNLLINSVRLGKDDLAQGRGMVDAVMVEAEKGVRDMDFDRAVDRSRCLKRGLAALLLGGCVLAFVVAAPQRFSNALGRLVAPTADIPAMGRVALGEVTPGDCEILAGNDLAIRATIAGKGEEDLDAFVFVQPRDGRERAYPMSPDGSGAYSYVVPGVRSPLRYHVEIGGTESRRYTVTIVRRPAVKRIELAYDFPRYTRLDSVTVENSDGSIQAVNGTTVLLKIEATKEIQKAWLERDERKQLSLSVGMTPTVLSGKLKVDGDYSYRVRLVDTNGYENVDPVERTVTALPDGKPTVTIAEPGKDVEAPLGGKLQVVLRGTDDFGIAGARLLMKKAGTGDEIEVNKWPDCGGGKAVCVTHDWAFPKDRFKAGEELTYWAEMTDTLPPPGPNRAASDRFVVKLIDVAEQRREQTEKYKLWEKKLQAILQKQKDARQEAGKLLAPSRGGKKP